MNLNIKLSKYRTTRSKEGDIDAVYDDEVLEPVMPAIDAVRQLDEEDRKRKSECTSNKLILEAQPSTSSTTDFHSRPRSPGTSQLHPSNIAMKHDKKSTDVSLRNSEPRSNPHRMEDVISRRAEPSCSSQKTKNQTNIEVSKSNSLNEMQDKVECPILVRNNPFLSLINNCNQATKNDEYEFIPKSVILDVYSNDPEVKRFLKQLAKIFNETGYNEQDYKCYSCRRPVGLVFGQSRLCHYDGHHYCSECHLIEKSVIPARIICNWDFNKYPVSKRNQHFLTLISNEPMFELRKVSPLLYKICPELREVEELRRQAFFVRSYCTTCVHESISFELTKLIWPKEHLIKQIDLYSIEDLVQVKNGTLKQLLKNVITFGRQHVLSCVLCCQKGFICELCKSSQIIYPFDTESVYRCNECQSIYHRTCFKSKTGEEACPRCQRLKSRRHDT